jgi:predicted transcriptional regulator
MSMNARFDLERARINAGYSIRGLARELKTHEATIRRLEQGLPVRPRSAKPVADFFEVQVTDLMPLKRGPRAAHDACDGPSSRGASRPRRPGNGYCGG